MLTVDSDLQKRRDMLAQWAFDTRPVLGRFHIWLEDVETQWNYGRPQPNQPSDMSFIPGGIERQLAMTCAVTALGTKLFGRYGEGVGRDKAGLNEVKKDADAVSAYAMSESLWYLTRHLPENHAIMVCLGEGLMPKAGETEEMGSNPNLGFGRVYARPGVAKFLDERVVRLLNEEGYGWDEFYGEIKQAGITVWGAAIDTLENTSRFALGREAGTMTILHVFDQPLHILRPYEGYMGSLTLPKEVSRVAGEQAILVDFRTPRAKIFEAILKTYPGIKPENIHVWTLAGDSREKRLSGLWKAWSDLGVHLIEDGWQLPGGGACFTESGTYSPTHSVGSWTDESGATHLLICDGYSASAEALQAASLAEVKNLDASMSVFTSKFTLPYDVEQHVMKLDPNHTNFEKNLTDLVGAELSAEEVQDYRTMIAEGVDAGLALHKPTLKADDFFPERNWKVLAMGGYMGPDPYTGEEGVEDLGDQRYRVSVRLLSNSVDKRVKLTLRLMEPLAESRSIFEPLLSRLLGGEPFETRAVKISDSGRIRNELQTLCAEALEFLGGNRVRVEFHKIPEAVFSAEKTKRLRELLIWYKSRHPVWFSWLELGS